MLLSAVVVSGCVGSKSDDDKKGDAAGRVGSHTVAQLCDFPKPFYRKYFNVAEIYDSPPSLSATSSPRHEDNIAIATICTYYSSSAHLGDVFFNPAGSSAAGAGGRTSIGDINVDGIIVHETQDPTPTWAVATGPQMITLDARVNGVYGSIAFRALDDQTVQVGAHTLIDMIKTMTK